MKLRFALPTAIVLMSCVVASPAYAEDDSVEQAIEELGSSNVYIEPGTPGTTDQTESSLQSKLQSDDGIILVMIPESDEPITQIAKEIDDATGNDSIIGLAVGNDVLGYSTALPDGVAADLMQRADNVSTSTVEALVTFTRTTHTYEAQNPDVFDPPPPPGAAPAEDGLAIWPFVLLGVLLVVAIVAAFIVAAGRRQSSDVVRLKKSPDQVKSELQSILNLRVSVQDQELRHAITQVVSDTESFFRRSVRSSGHDTEQDAEVYLRHLRGLSDVLKRYIDIQENPRFYDEPRQLLRSGAAAVDSFGEFVLESIKRDSVTQLTRYKVDTDILKATRYR